MSAQCTIQVPFLKVNAQAVALYLMVMGAAFTAILAFLALVLLAYVCQMFFLSVAELLRLFSQFPPPLQLAFFGLAAAIALYILRARAAAKVRATHEQ